MNLARRCKRLAWARSWRLFAACAPGLEPLAAAELAGLEADEITPLNGGVEFSGRLDLAYACNLRLRTVSRVWLRLIDFRVRGWEDLVRQAGRVPWEVFIPAGAPLSVQVEIKASNLRHSGRIAEVVLRAAAGSLAAAGQSPPEPATPGAEGARRVLVRAHGRRCAISLDSSGEHLHRRGYRLQPGPAPLREDIAAALLLHCGHDPAAPLLDGMCGAGTIACEAALLARNLAPGLYREPAMTAWPCHRPDTWRHLRGLAERAAAGSAPAAIHARDLDPETLARARANAARAGVAGDITFDQADFFAAEPPAGPGLVLLNPPYGRRLGSVRAGRDLAKRLGRRLREAYPGWRAGVVLYRPEWAELIGLVEPRALVTRFGGITVTLLAGLVPPAV